MKLDFTKSFQRDTFLDLDRPVRPATTYKYEYKILKEDTSSQLEQSVNQYMQQGWTLQGGVSVAYVQDEESLIFTQVMLKRN